MYATGKGVEKDDDEAMKWFLKADELGNEDAQGGINRIIVATTNSDELHECLSVSFMLIQHGDFDSAIKRYSTCQSSIFNFHDQMAYLNTGKHFSTWIYFKNIDWILSQQGMPLEIQQLKHNLVTYMVNRAHDKGIVNEREGDSKTSYLAGAVAVAVVGAGVGAGGVELLWHVWHAVGGYFDLKYEETHPLATLNKRFVEKYVHKINAVKHLLQIQESFVGQLNINNSTEEIKAVFPLAATLDRDKEQLQNAYSKFMSEYVTVPVLLRTRQLIYIADKESWTGYDNEYLDKAALVLGSLNQAVIMGTSHETREMFRQTYSQFKSAAAEAEMEDLKVIQNLEPALLEKDNKDAWWGQ